MRPPIDYPPLSPQQQALALSCLNLARKLAMRYARTLGADEAVSVAHWALSTAAARYDPARGVKFTTYAGQRVKGYLRAAAFAAWQRRLRGGAVYPFTDLAGDLELGLDRPDGGAGPEDLAQGLEGARRLRGWLARLPARERAVVEGRFLCGQSLGEIGESLGVSKERVRQIQVQTIQRLRAMARGGAA